MAICKRLVQEQPSVAEFQDRLAWCYHNLATVCSSNEEAKAFYLGAIELSGRLAAEHPLAPHYQHRLAESYELLGNLEAMMGNTDKSIELLEQAIELRLPLLENHPSILSFRQALADAYVHLGMLCSNRDEATTLYNTAIDLSDQLVARHSTIVAFQLPFEAARANLAVVTQDALAALPVLENGRSRLEGILKQIPRNWNARRYLANICHEQARIKATSTHESVRDVVAAVADATTACELTDWRHYAYVQTLAAACAAAGEMEKGELYQQQAIDLAPCSVQSELQSGRQ